MGISGNINSFTTSMTNKVAEPLWILTDLEPDDRFAMLIIRSLFDQVNFGACLMHAGRKKELIERCIDHLNFQNTPVYQGTGGEGESYGTVPGTKAARTYSQEGKAILGDSWEEVSNRPRSSKELQEKILESLEKAEPKSVKFLIITAPTDLMAVLKARPELKEKIKEIVFVGGYVLDLATGAATTSYNSDMDINAAQELMSLKEVPITLFSSHVIKQQFGGGSINDSNAPRLMQKIRDYAKEFTFFQEAAVAVKSWNEHVKEVLPIPVIQQLIEKYPDQFTPADPCGALAIIDPTFIKKKMPITITIDSSNKGQGPCSVMIKNDPKSLVSLVTEIDKEGFEDRMINCLVKLKQAGIQRILSDSTVRQ